MNYVQNLSFWYLPLVSTFEVSACSAINAGVVLHLLQRMLQSVKYLCHYFLSCLKEISKETWISNYFCVSVTVAILLSFLKLHVVPVHYQSYILSCSLV